MWNTLFNAFDKLFIVVTDSDVCTVIMVVIDMIIRLMK